MGRISDKKGMSIVELLSAIAVMLLVTVVLVTGVRLGVKAYTKSVSMSEAQILCTTLTTAVSDELRYAGSIYIDENGKVGFFSQNVGGDSQTGSSFTSDENGYVMLGETPILSKSSYPYGIKAEVAVTMDETDKIFNAKVTVRSKKGTELSSNEFQVKPVRRSSLEINKQ
ncbi:MAG: hypothetical protein Q4D00_08950 [Clostridia bacterium]|nr:hypothetical protein [Clostridia bacterium]